METKGCILTWSALVRTWHKYFTSLQIIVQLPEIAFFLKIMPWTKLKPKPRHLNYFRGINSSVSSSRWPATLTLSGCLIFALFVLFSEGKHDFNIIMDIFLTQCQYLATVKQWVSDRISETPGGGDFELCLLRRMTDLLRVINSARLTGGLIKVTVDWVCWDFCARAHTHTCTYTHKRTP